MKRENRTKDVVIQLIATVFLATSGIFVRHISIAPLNVGFWRILFSMFLHLYFANISVAFIHLFHHKFSHIFHFLTKGKSIFIIRVLVLSS